MFEERIEIAESLCYRGEMRAIGWCVWSRRIFFFSLPPSLFFCELKIEGGFLVKHEKNWLASIQKELPDQFQISEKCQNWEGFYVAYLLTSCSCFDTVWQGSDTGIGQGSGI